MLSFSHHVTGGMNRVVRDISPQVSRAPGKRQTTGHQSRVTCCAGTRDALLAGNPAGGWKTHPGLPESFLHWLGSLGGAWASATGE